MYAIETPILFSAKASLEAFQCIEFASGDVATPTSPIEPPRASGAIIKKGTAVVMVFNWRLPYSLSCPTKLTLEDCETIF